jgi:cell division protein FtsN
LAQDEYYYEIQLTNKQLVFYFMAGAAFLVMSFLAGIVVGRGVDSTAEATTVQQAPVRAAAMDDTPKDVVVKEEGPGKAATASPQDLNFGQLESEQKNYGLEKPQGGNNTKSAMADGLTAVPPAAVKPSGNASAHTSAPPAAKTSVAVKQPPSANVVASAPTTKPVAAKPDPHGKSAPAPPVVAGGFTIQVGAFKDKAGASAIASRLKAKGFAAYVVTPEGAAGGLFNVRVGAFKERPQAEKVEARLRDEEKFKPFIVKQ